MFLGEDQDVDCKGANNYNKGFLTRNAFKKEESIMKEIATMMFIVFLIFALNSIALAASQGDGSSKPSAGAVVSDILVLRPLGLAGTVLGGAAFVVSLPVTLATHKVESAEKILVEEPFSYTFERPLGEM
jgi:hypothetical protein